MKILLYIGLLLGVCFLPVQGTDVGELIPVEVIAVSEFDGRVVVRTDTGDQGTGNTLQAAFEDLKAIGFDDEIIDALKLMTHDETVSYMEYVTAIKSNPIASAVKLADLEHNSDLSRLDVIDEKALKRKEKYATAIALLKG